MATTKARKARKPARMVRLTSVVIGAVAALVALADAHALGLVSHWQDQAEALVQENESTGTEVSALQAQLAEQVSLRSLLSGQAGAARSKTVELADAEAVSVADAYEIRDAVVVLEKCHDAQLRLLDYLWATKASTFGADRIAAVAEKCDAAKKAFNKVKTYE